MAKKRYLRKDVLTAARERIAETFDNVERYYVAFSGGKDSSVMFHLVMDEAIKRNLKVGVMFIDFEAQYAATIKHIHEMLCLYHKHIDAHWICIPMLLRNAVTNYEPRWMCWEPGKETIWLRDKPHGCKKEIDYPFGSVGMEFEEFIVLFGKWYGSGKKTAGFIGIRAQESLHRYCAVATWEKRDPRLTIVVGRLKSWIKFTTFIRSTIGLLRIFGVSMPNIQEKPHNKIYDLMQMAGVPLTQQRLCQPFVVYTTVLKLWLVNERHGHV